ncbi:hypothetical protein L8P40_20790 [Enterobacter kobei]|uniref:hypothetical protein n=1 Tax=Enterobacter kobei TaxID=208224 RepID=UPI002006681F|nr:hypothetical protein [Enterobacter kobei]MCK7157752.1 hypothetical protein [Enterobacter kobei]MCK7243501.1 hypothetical protein [Enterobacter kobei]MCK7359491.1 hypothetical protein [Enterobacter roggenkampii]
MDIPSNEIPRENFNALKNALVSAANANSKEAAASHISIAEYQRYIIRRFITDYVDEQLTGAIEFARKAAGRVKNKDQLMSNASYFRMKFEGMVTLVD